MGVLVIWVYLLLNGNKNLFSVTKNIIDNYLVSHCCYRCCDIYVPHLFVRRDSQMTITQIVTANNFQSKTNNLLLSVFLAAIFRDTAWGIEAFIVRVHKHACFHFLYASYCWNPPKRASVHGCSLTATKLRIFNKFNNNVNLYLRTEIDMWLGCSHFMLTHRCQMRENSRALFGWPGVLFYCTLTTGSFWGSWHPALQNVVCYTAQHHLCGRHILKSFWPVLPWSAVLHRNAFALVPGLWCLLIWNHVVMRCLWFSVFYQHSLKHCHHCKQALHLQW